MRFPKGSEWRKWDLHIHTPASALNNNFTGQSPEEKWKNYLLSLESITDVSVLGITDYFSIEGYEKCLEEKKLGRLQNFDLLLPNVELRLSINTKNGTPINIHVIFNPDIAERLNTLFFNNIKFTYNGNNYPCTKDEIIRLGRVSLRNTEANANTAYIEGITQFKVDVVNLRDTLLDNKDLRGNYIVCVPNSNNDGNSGIQDGSLKAIREEIYRIADIIFSSNPKDRTYFLGDGCDAPEVIAEKFGKIKPCVHGSDAHDNNKICKDPYGRYTWVKADPTFEGLKQIILEPEDRVRIQDASPDNTHPKLCFDLIKANGDVFKDGKPALKDVHIPLNHSLVTIIGGRGTGKSLLLDVLYSTFNKGNKSHDGRTSRLERIGTPYFSATLSKSDGSTTEFVHEDQSHPFEYLHVRQGEVKQVAEDKEELAKAIYKLLNVVDTIDFSDMDSDATKINAEYEALCIWLSKQDDDGNRINTIDYQSELVIKTKALIDTITTQEVKDKIAKYMSNSTEMSAINTNTLYIDKLWKKLEETQNEINDDIMNINIMNVPQGLHLNFIDYSEYYSKLTSMYAHFRSEHGKLQSENTHISTDLTRQGLSGDIAGLLSKVESYQKSITDAETHIQLINVNLNAINATNDSRKPFGKAVAAVLKSKAANIHARYATIKNGKGMLGDEHKAILQELLANIDINGEIVFNREVFYSGLKEFWFLDARRGNQLS